MTLPKEVTDLVESWFETYGKVKLTSKNGRDQLLAGLKATTHYSGFSECKKNGEGFALSLNSRLFGVKKKKNDKVKGVTRNDLFFDE